MSQNSQWNAYSAGNKVYGGGRPMPTVGPVDPIGYAERDAKKKRPLWQNAAQRRLMAMKKNKPMSADALRPIG